MSEGVFNLWDQRRGQSHGAPLMIAPLKVREAAFADPATLSPREWLHGVDLVIGYVSVLVAPGGVGKTTLGLTMGLAVASGHELLKQKVWVSGNVLFCGLEDPDEETDRRLAAIQLQYELEAEQLQGRVFKITPDDAELVIAEIAADGMTIAYPHRDSLVQVIREHAIKLVVVDPFVNCHRLEENSNPHMNAVARAWRQVATEARCAVLLVHHTRKGAEAGDAEGARGAKAVIDAARVSYTLTPMSKDEASQWGIGEAMRRFHVRMDDAKRNMAPPEKARWYRLVGVRLNNGTPLYPNGDEVQAIVPWDPPSLFGDATHDRLNEVLDVISAGLDGVPYAPDRRGRNNTRWVGQVLMNYLAMAEDQAVQAVGIWIRNGVLVVGRVAGPDRKEIGSVSVGKRFT
jgi:hypothetical protein